MNWRSFLLFFAAVCLLVASFGVGIGAFEYKVVSEGEVSSVPQKQGFGGAPVYTVNFSDLPARDQRVVAGAIAGEEYVFRNSSKLPGRRNRKGLLGVRKGGELYLINRKLFFNWRTPFAAVAAAFALAGLALGWRAVQREHL